MEFATEAVTHTAVVLPQDAQLPLGIRPTERTKLSQGVTHGCQAGSTVIQQYSVRTWLPLLLQLLLQLLRYLLLTYLICG